MPKDLRGRIMPPRQHGGIWLLLGIFVAFNLASAVYILVTGEYNGDFFGVPVELSRATLLICVVATTAPFVLLASISRSMLQRRGPFQVWVPLGFLKFAVPITLILQIFITYRYQVGIIGQPPYEVSGPMKVVVLLLNRFQPFYLGTLLILLLPRGSRLGWLVAALLVTVGLMRAGLGAFFYLGLVLLLKNQAAVRDFARHHRLRLIVGFALLPFLVAMLYELRSTLREDDVAREMPVATVVFGMFLGRMSSLTNSMVIIENASHFREAARELETTYFVQQAIGGVVGSGLGPKVTPQYLLINIHGTDIENYSYMTGLVGDLVIAWNKSPLVMLLNFVTTVTMLYLALWFARILRIPNAVPFAFTLLLYPVMSGVASEIAAVAYFFALMVAVFALVNLLSLAGRVPRAIRAASHAHVAARSAKFR
jgi:hypothetical protein